MANILKIQDQLKGMPDEHLAQEMQQPSGMAPPYLILGELQRRRDMRQEATAANAGRQHPAASMAETIPQEVAGSAPASGALPPPTPGGVPGATMPPTAGQAGLPASPAMSGPGGTAQNPKGYAQGGAIRGFQNHGLISGRNVFSGRETLEEQRQRLLAMQAAQYPGFGQIPQHASLAPPPVFKAPDTSLAASLAPMPLSEGQAQPFYPRIMSNAYEQMAEGHPSGIGAGATAPTSRLFARKEYPFRPGGDPQALPPALSVASTSAPPPSPGLFNRKSVASAPEQVPYTHSTSGPAGITARTAPATSVPALSRAVVGSGFHRPGGAGIAATQPAVQRRGKVGAGWHTTPVEPLTTGTAVATSGHAGRLASQQAALKAQQAEAARIANESEIYSGTMARGEDAGADLASGRVAALSPYAGTSGSVLGPGGRPGKYQVPTLTGSAAPDDAIARMIARRQGRPEAPASTPASGAVSGAQPTVRPGVTDAVANKVPKKPETLADLLQSTGVNVAPSSPAKLPERPAIERAEYDKDFWKAQLDAIKTPSQTDAYKKALDALTPEKESGRFKDLTKRITEMESGMSGRKEDAIAFALMEAGMGIAGSKSQTLGGAIAEGGLPAIKSYRKSMAELRKDKRAMYDLHSQVAGLHEARDTARRQRASTLAAADVAAQTGSNRARMDMAARAREADLKVKQINIQAQIAEDQQYVAMRGQDINERLANTGHAIGWRKLGMDDGYRKAMLAIENDNVVLDALAEERQARTAGNMAAVQQAQIRNLDGRLALAQNPEQAAGQMAAWFGNLPSETQKAYLQVKGLSNGTEAALRKHFTETYQRAESGVNKLYATYAKDGTWPDELDTAEKREKWRVQQIRTAFMTAKLAGSGSGVGAVIAASE